VILRQDRDQLLRGGVPPITRPTLLPVAGSPRWRRVIYAMVDIEAVAVRLACGSALFIHHRPRLVRVQHGTYNVVNGCADFCASNDCVPAGQYLSICVRTRARSVPTFRGSETNEFCGKHRCLLLAGELGYDHRARQVSDFERIFLQRAPFVGALCERVNSLSEPGRHPLAINFAQDLERWVTIRAWLERRRYPRRMSALQSPR
jgi:hypothetical protein